LFKSSVGSKHSRTSLYRSEDGQNKLPHPYKLLCSRHVVEYFTFLGSLSSWTRCLLGMWDLYWSNSLLTDSLLEKRSSILVFEASGQIPRYVCSWSYHLACCLKEKCLFGHSSGAPLWIEDPRKRSTVEHRRIGHVVEYSCHFEEDSETLWSMKLRQFLNFIWYRYSKCIFLGDLRRNF